MAYAGARGNTEREMSDVLCFHYPQAGFHSALRQLNDHLVSREGLELRIANGCWGREDMTYLDPFLDTLSADYGADMDTLDFAHEPEESRATINQWAQENTEGLIKNLVPPGEITLDTYLVLANTVYFKAEWLDQFDPRWTGPGNFRRLDGSEIAVPMMQGENVYPYYLGDGYRAVELPYKGETISMVVILPDEGRFTAFEASFDAAVFSSIVEGLEDTLIRLYFPRFSFSSDFLMIPTLQAMGMTEAFVPGLADFSGMDGTDDGSPWIDLVAHKAFISVDELGTLAAGGTVVELTISMMETFYGERPFIFVIRDVETGTILFLGRVLDPSG
jgi:serpin B